MATHPLTRFLDSGRGPVVQLSTIPYELSDGTHFYYSIAELSKQITKGYRQNDSLLFCGAGWNRSRLASQEKAIVEAIERWAFRHFYQSSPADAALNLDSTSNGFAAVPKDFGIEAALSNSICEAAERFFLNQFWEHSLALTELDPSACLSQEVLSLFSQYPGRLKLASLSIEVPADDLAPKFLVGRRIHFTLSLFYREGAGVTPGSACGLELETTLERAVLENLNHLKAMENIEQKLVALGDTVTDRRLHRFATEEARAIEVANAWEKSMNAKLINAFPKLTFVRELIGPWNPEVLVTRALVDGSPPIDQGDDLRFLI